MWTSRAAAMTSVGRIAAHIAARSWSDTSARAGSDATSGCGGRQG
jgi:hypothetical protein